MKNKSYRELIVYTTFGYMAWVGKQNLKSKKYESRGGSSDFPLPTSNFPLRKSEVGSRKSEVSNQKWEVGSKKWEVGGQKSNHAALSLNGKKSEIRSWNFVRSEVWSLKCDSQVGGRKSEVGRPSSAFVLRKGYPIYFSNVVEMR